MKKLADITFYVFITCMMMVFVALAIKLTVAIIFGV
jgi:hypothetical protein